jgi:hypothetical protein
MAESSLKMRLNVRRQAHGLLELELKFGSPRRVTLGCEEFTFDLIHPALNLIRCIAALHTSSPLQIAGLCE